MARNAGSMMNRHITERGFTLVELLVTMGLMALLATVSIAGYYGAVRGMTERGVKQDVVAFVRNAQQRAMVEQTPTAVFFMNRYLREDDEELGEVSRIVGVAVAVRMAGRISLISKSGLYGVGGVYLADEYADLDKTYPTNSISRQPVSKSSMRLYRMCTDANSFEQSYSLVEDQVVQAKLTFNRDDLLNTSQNPTLNGCIYNDNDIEDAVKGSAWAFRVSQQNNGLDGGRWRVGDPYGTEIGTLQLPHGYVFGTGGMPTSVGDTKGAGKPQFFDPGTLSATTVKGSKFKFDTIAIAAFRPGSDTPKKFDSISKSDLDDDSKD